MLYLVLRLVVACATIKQRSQCTQEALICTTCKLLHYLGNQLQVPVKGVLVG